MQESKINEEEDEDDDDDGNNYSINSGQESDYPTTPERESMDSEISQYNSPDLGIINADGSFDEEINDDTIEVKNVWILFGICKVKWNRSWMI